MSAPAPGSAPTAVFPSGAKYRLTVTNIGSAPLTNVVVNDPTLGIVNHPVGNLAVGDSVILDQGDITALFVDDRCTRSGTFANTASTSGASSTPEASVAVIDHRVAAKVAQIALGAHPDPLLHQAVRDGVGIGRGPALVLVAAADDQHADAILDAAEVSCKQFFEEKIV